MIGGAGIGLGLRGKQSNAITLPAGETYLLPAGRYQVTLGPYTLLQFLDPVTGIWRTLLGPGSVGICEADGSNQRLANLTGCPVAAIVTTTTSTGAVTGIGTTATTLVVTPSSGSSVWSPIIGGAISTTCLTGVTGSTVGAGYLFPPTAIISAPPPGGLQATCHITGIPTTGALLAAQVIIDNQGAGYPVKSTGVANATLTLINDPRDTTGSGATVILAATGTGALTGLYPINQGVPLTGVLTLAFGTGIAAATVVMNLTVTTFVTGYTGVVFSTGGTLGLVSVGNMVNPITAVPVYTNPIHETQATFPRPARISITAGSTITTSGAVVEDGGFGIQLVPALTPVGLLASMTSFVTGVVATVATVGGVKDTSWVQPI